MSCSLQFEKPDLFGRVFPYAVPQRKVNADRSRAHHEAVAGC
jgi:hypothetical protein